jgi:hypothetical protein
VAKAFARRPGAVLGNCPAAQPWAVGIFSVGMLPCGLAAGMVGAVPTAWAGTGPCKRRHRMAASPTLATRLASRLSFGMVSGP